MFVRDDLEDMKGPSTDARLPSAASQFLWLAAISVAVVFFMIEAGRTWGHSGLTLGALIIGLLLILSSGLTCLVLRHAIRRVPIKG